MMWYIVSFYRQHWGLPTEFVGMIWSAFTFVHVIGSMLCGRVVPRIGRKRLTGLTALIVGVLMIIYPNVPNYWVSILVNLTISFMLALWTSSSNDLALAQVPEYSGALMSLNSGSNRLGGAMGTALGGLVLTLGGYNLLGIASGLAGIIAFLIIFLFARDPSHIVTACARGGL
jgi:predicted MFS family arabinose efflux permease